MSAAEQLSAYEARLPPSTPERRARENVLKELMHRLVEMGALEDGWDGHGSKRPSADLLKCAADLGLMIVGSTFPIPNSLNVGASADGFVQFSLFGANGREADLWLESANGEFSYVCSEPGEVEAGEGKMRIADYMKFAAWLSGETH